MKKSAFFMAIPATLIAALFVFGQPANTNKSFSDQSPVCLQMNQGYLASADTLRKDPICGMMADDEKKDTVHYKNKVFAFCSKHCKAEFVKDPEAYMPKKKN
ncbi:MAG: YHS domain-containing protein [Chitinophagaceae bacterium]